MSNMTKEFHPFHRVVIAGQEIGKGVKKITVGTSRMTGVDMCFITLADFLHEMKPLFVKDASVEVHFGYRGFSEVKVFSGYLCDSDGKKELTLQCKNCGVYGTYSEAVSRGTLIIEEYIDASPASIIRDCLGKLGLGKGLNILDIPVELPRFRVNGESLYQVIERINRTVQDSFGIDTSQNKYWFDPSENFYYAAPGTEQMENEITDERLISFRESHSGLELSNLVTWLLPEARHSVFVNVTSERRGGVVTMAFG